MPKPSAMTPIGLSTRVSREPDIISTEMDGEVVMMSIEHGTYYGLTGIGSFLWDALQDTPRIQTLCERVLGEYNVDRTTCETDVLEVVQDMLDHGILKRAG